MRTPDIKQSICRKERCLNMILNIKAGDILQMKKKHPCGGNQFTVLRTGSDIRIRCNGCGRDVTVARIKLEPSVKTVIQKEEEL